MVTMFLETLYKRVGGILYIPGQAKNKKIKNNKKTNHFLG